MFPRVKDNNNRLIINRKVF